MTIRLVRDLMTVGVLTCKTSTPALDVARFLLEKNLDELVVLNDEGEAVGICGLEQLAPLYGRDDLASLTAEDVMSEGVPDLPADLPVSVAAQTMIDRGIRTAYMMHNSAGIIYPAGFISFRHILRGLAARDDQELSDLGIAAKRQAPLDVFIKRRDEARRRSGAR
jgi:CBS domain-containing protein